MPLIRCPICDKSFQSEQATSLPFCSDRCRSIDLGRWLDERYTLPSERAEDPDSESDESGRAEFLDDES